MVGEGLPDHPADDRVVVHLLEGCVEAGREGKRANQHGWQQPRGWVDGWMDGWMIEKGLNATVNAMNGVT